jgi:hypothetical protein
MRIICSKQNPSAQYTRQPKTRLELTTHGEQNQLSYLPLFVFAGDVICQQPLGETAGRPSSTLCCLMLDVEIIEISPSPSNSRPVPKPFLKSPKYASKGKQKMKEVEVIELTDNEDDEHSPNRLPEPLDSSSSTATVFRNLTKEQFVIDLDATSDDMLLPAEAQHADAILMSGDTKGI